MTTEQSIENAAQRLAAEAVHAAKTQGPIEAARRALEIRTGKSDLRYNAMSIALEAAAAATIDETAEPKRLPLFPRWLEKGWGLCRDDGGRIAFLTRSVVEKAETGSDLDRRFAGWMLGRAAGLALERGLRVM